MIARAPLTLQLLFASSLASGCYSAKGDTSEDGGPSGELWDQWEMDDDDEYYGYDEGYEEYSYSEEGWYEEGKPNPYASYEGWQIFLYYYGPGEPTHKEYNCRLIWDVTGYPVPTIPYSCPDCEFLFEVEMEYDGGEYAGYSYDDGTCAGLAQDMRYVYGYSEAYGYGTLMMGYGGYAYYARGYGYFDGGTFRYSRGTRDYGPPYYGHGGAYTYTAYYYGYARVE